MRFYFSSIVNVTSKLSTQNGNSLFFVSLSTQIHFLAVVTGDWTLGCVTHFKVNVVFVLFLGKKQYFPLIFKGVSDVQ